MKKIAIGIDFAKEKFDVTVKNVETIESTSKCNLSAKLGIMFEKDLIWCIEI